MLASYHVRCTTWNSKMMKGTLAHFVECFLLSIVPYRIAVVATLFTRCFMMISAWIAARISRKWIEFGVGGTMQDVAIVMDALSGEGRYTRSFVLVLVLFYSVFAYLLHVDNWPKEKISNRDAIRLQLACDVMRINPRDSIYYTALNAFGEQSTNK